MHRKINIYKNKSVNLIGELVRNTVDYSLVLLPLKKTINCSIERTKVFSFLLTYQSFQ